MYGSGERRGLTLSDLKLTFPNSLHLSSEHILTFHPPTLPQSSFLPAPFLTSPPFSIHLPFLTTPSLPLCLLISLLILTLHFPFHQSTAHFIPLHLPSVPHLPFLSNSSTSLTTCYSTSPLPYPGLRADISVLYMNVCMHVIH